MVRAAQIVGVFALVGCGCRGDAAVAGVPASEADDAAPAVKPVKPVKPAAPVEPPRSPIGDWGVEIYTPPGAQVVHEVAADRHSVHLGYNVDVGLQRFDLAAPGGLAEALVAWDQGDELRKLGEGTTPDGVHYASRSFQVRDGRSGPGGRTVHFYIRVTRVYAVIAVNETSRVECTGYVERDVEDVDDADLAAVREVCLSLRRR